MEGTQYDVEAGFQAAFSSTTSETYAELGQALAVEAAKKLG
jgi:hypothetical protein